MDFWNISIVLLRNAKSKAKHTQCLQIRLVPLVFSLLEVVSSPESDKVGVVGGGGVGDAAGTADVGVAELVGETLKLIGCELIVVPQDMIVGGTTGTLEERKREREREREKSSEV